MFDGNQRTERIYRIAGFLSILLSTIFFWFIGFVIWKKFHYMDDINAALLNQTFITGTYGVLPENVEKMQYICALLFFPIALFILNKVFIQALQQKGIDIDKFYSLISIASISIILFFVFFDLKENMFYISGSVLYQQKGNYFYYQPLNSILLILLLISLYVLYSKTSLEIKLLIDKISSYLFLLTTVTLIICWSLKNVTTIYDPGNLSGDHFVAVFNSAAQVYLGRALLIDFPSQYGLYPHLLQPLFKLMGLDIFKFTSIMAVFLAISYLNVYIFLRSMLRNKLIVFAGFNLILFYSFLYITISASYFQYFPLRLLFPVLLINLSWFYFNKKNVSIYFASFILYSIGVLWNLETGIVVFFTWLLALTYHELLEANDRNAIKRIAKHILVAFSSLCLTFSLFDIYMYFSYGSFPDFSKFIEYQNIFYVLGFYMLPMKLMHPWNLIFFVYMVGLSYSARSLIIRDNSVRVKMIFILSILGAGIFSYFQGRSHDAVLTAVWYPAMLLLVICLDDLFYKIKGELKVKKVDILEASIFLSLIVLVVSSNLSLFDNSPNIYNLIESRHEIASRQAPNDLTEGIKFIKNLTIPGEKVLILSPFSGIYYLGSSTVYPLKIPAYPELFLRKDYNALLVYLKNSSYKLFVDPRIYNKFPAMFENISIGYKAISKGGGLIRYKIDNSPEKRLSFVLPESKNTIAHYKFDDRSYLHVSFRNRHSASFSGNASKLSNLGDNFTIEFISKPQKNQPAYASILGNHPGSTGHSGFVVQRDNINDNIYIYIYSTLEQARTGCKTMWVRSNLGLKMKKEHISQLLPQRKLLLYIKMA